MNEFKSFLEAWHGYMVIGAILSFSLGIIIYLIHQLRVSMISDYKAKHDFINANEIRWYKMCFYCFGLCTAFLINTYGNDKFEEFGVWFYVRIFFSIAGATLVAYIASLILDFYYPTKLNAKLRRWRYMPRTNPKNGHKMRLLSEDEEDVHLHEGMQAEESVFSIDYDVWLDEKTGDIQIEKYEGHLTALRCNNCGFYTMRVVKEEIVERHDDGSPKELIKNYQCSYCKNVRATQFHITQKETEDYKSMKPKSKKMAKDIEAIRIEIHSSVEGKKFYEFQNLEEARKFLAEFDYDKVA
jgi:hypothetical protein